ncbi:phage baseplate protein [Vibrio paucivorans]|uniref:Dit-like phage tail protein N-terminal domain-containing protein n=1 Tax=Vibrio paucivorans TaxID=2829489 RepID=A0A9X3CKV1_9VIBR|nr:hypothetical protein [Vibrio paucivorans]MCW8336590.1 hypothetical protein [Vibrio paucivorans]
MAILWENDKRAYIVRQDENEVTGLTLSSGSPDGALIMSATTESNATLSGSLTMHPVSDGSDRADHYTTESSRFTLTGVLDEIPQLFQAHGRATELRSYVDEIYEIRDNKVLCTVRIPDVGIFNDCMIISARFTKDHKTGNGLRASLTFQEFLIAEPLRTRTPAAGHEFTTAEVRHFSEVSKFPAEPPTSKVNSQEFL